MHPSSSVCLHCASELTSHPFLLLKVLIPRFSVELLRQTQAAALSFASELRETEKKERDSREGDMVGRLIHVLIEGFVKGLRQDVRCTLGIFSTLWKLAYAHADVPP